MNSIKLLSNEVAFGMGATIQLQFYVAKTPTQPTSAKFTLKSPSGITIIDAQDMTLLTDELLEYSLESTDIENLGENYRIYVEYIYSGVTYPVNFLLDVVLTPLVLSITDLDLQERHPNLADDLWTGQTSYETQIALAFDVVKTDIKNRGNRPDMLIDNRQIEIPIEYKSLELIFFDFATSNEGINWERYIEYKRKYSEFMSNLIVKYDSNRDGIIDSVESIGNLRLLR